jgi:hypothetical protein
VRENLWEDYLWERDGEGRTVEGFWGNYVIVIESCFFIDFISSSNGGCLSFTIMKNLSLIYSQFHSCISNGANTNCGGVYNIGDILKIYRTIFEFCSTSFIGMSVVFTSRNKIDCNCFFITSCGQNSSTRKLKIIIRKWSDLWKNWPFKKK